FGPPKRSSRIPVRGSFSLIRPSVAHAARSGAPLLPLLLVRRSRTASGRASACFARPAHRRFEASGEVRGERTGIGLAPEPPLQDPLPAEPLAYIRGSNPDQPMHLVADGETVGVAELV